VTVVRRERWKVAGVCVVLAALVWVVFGQTLSHGFVNYDDDKYVYENPVVSKGLSLGGVGWALSHIHALNWHPVTTLTHMLDCQLYGLQPWGHHLDNLLLHGAGAILLFLAIRRMSGATWRSALVAVVWALHPLRVESVAWVSERKDVLSGVFFMLTLLAYCHYVERQKSRARYWMVAALFALGLMCKQTLVTLPFVLLLLDWWPLGRWEMPEGAGWKRGWQGAKPLLMEKVPLFGISAVFCMVTLYAQQQALHDSVEVSFPWRVANALVAYAVYLLQMVWPADLAVLYPHPGSLLPLWKTGVALLVLGAVFTMVVFLGRRHAWLAVGWLWYLGMLVPVIGIVQVGQQARADRYTYLPQIGLCMMAAWGVGEMSSGLRWKPWVPGMLSVVVLAALMVTSHKQVAYWKESETLWTHTLACTEQNSLAYYDLGTALLQKGLIEEAIAQYHEALRIKPVFLDAHYNLGNALLQKGRIGEAIVQYREALRIKPSYVEAHSNLGNALLQEGQVEEPIAEFREALRINPDYVVAMNNLAYSLATAGDGRLRNGREALEMAHRANELTKEGNPVILETLAAAYAETGRFAEAEETVRRAIELAKAQGNLALAGNLEEHLKLYQTGQPLRNGPVH
jgi:protein O-mannosyl-transferase